MTPGQLLYVLGIITGGALASLLWVGIYLWHVPEWHRHGYQDHRDEIRAIRNTAELAAIPEPVIRAKGRTDGPHRQNRHDHPYRRPPVDSDDDPRAGSPQPDGMVDDSPRVRQRDPHPAGSRRPVTRGYTDAGTIPPVICPQPGTVIPLRTQAAPAKHGAAETEAFRKAEDFIDGIRRRGAVDRAMIERGEPLT